MTLQTVEEIERAIGTLAPGQIEDLYAWLDRNFPPAIDLKIPSDLAAGRLDKAISSDLKTNQTTGSGRTSPLGATSFFREYTNRSVGETRREAWVKGEIQAAPTA